MKRFWMIVLIGAAWALCPAAVLQAQTEMTAEAAVRLALENNYGIRIARNTAEIARNDRGKGLAGFLPVVDTGTSFRYDASSERTHSPLSFKQSDIRTQAYQVSLNWTLFDGFRMFAGKARYDELARLGELKARDVIESTVVAVMRAYFNLVQQEQLRDVVLSTRDVSKTRLDREQVRRDLGGSSSTDLLNARVNFNNDQAALLDREVVADVARKDLNILLARNPQHPFSVKKQIDIPPMQNSLDGLLQLARQQNSLLQAARKDKRVADESVRIARSVFWPRLGLSAQYGYTDRTTIGGQSASPGFSADRNRRTLDASVGLVMSLNLFNGNLDRINYQNARLEAKNRHLFLQNLENELAGLVQEKYRTLQKRLEKVRLEEQNSVTARQNLELQLELYAIGASDSLDFRDAQVQLARNQAELISARYQARITLLDLQQLTGTLRIDPDA